MVGFTPSRLTVARTWRGLTKKDLAESVGVTPAAITQFEAGTSQPREATVERIAFTLGVAPRFFAASELARLPAEAASFRSLRSMTTSIRERVLSSASVAVELITPILKELFELPVENLLDLSSEEPETAANILRSHWRLGRGPIGNVVHMLEAKGVVVYWLSEEHNSVDALSAWWNNSPHVLLNTFKEAGDHGRFDAAHELGHLVLHRNLNTMVDRDLESEANRFAAAFLVPSEQFLVECPSSPTLNQLQALKKRWKVSIAALLRRARDLGKLSRWQYESACKELSFRGWRTTEPVPIPRERSGLFPILTQKLVVRGTSWSKIAERVVLSEHDLLNFLYLELASSTPASLDPNSSGEPKALGKGHLYLIRS